MPEHHDHSNHDHDHDHRPEPEQGHEHGHTSGHDHGHGHANDQGIRGVLRYLRFAPKMWRSDINDAVIDMVAPQPDERVVDIGAGMGAGTVVAARTGASIIAIEPTPFLRRVLTLRRWLQRNRSAITVVDASAEQLAADDSTIDAIWAVNTMHHWLDPARGAAEVSRCLRPGGRVVLVDENFLDPTHPEHERFSKHNEDDGHSHGFSMVDAERMDALLTPAGLVDVDARNQSLAGRPSIVVTGRAAPVD